MTLALDQPTKPHVKRWTKREYHRLVDRCAFRGERVILFRGELIEMPPMGALHAHGIANINDWLHQIVGAEYRVRIQSPLETPGESVPEPDGAVVTHEQMSRRPHPNAAVLVIEISDSSLELDREMAFEYAAAGVPDYWIVDMQNRAVEVFRDPIADSSAPLGFRYQSREVFTENQSISPLIAPNALVSIARLVAMA